jgi:hypothetical protein
MLKEARASFFEDKHGQAYVTRSTRCAPPSRSDLKPFLMSYALARRNFLRLQRVFPLKVHGAKSLDTSRKGITHLLGDFFSKWLLDHIH